MVRFIRFWLGFPFWFLGILIMDRKDVYEVIKRITEKIESEQS